MGEQEEPCSCKKTLCLKMYCHCFQSSTTCSYLCRCVDCKNTTTNSADILEARRSILARNPMAFQNKFVQQSPQALQSGNTNNVSPGFVSANKATLCAPVRETLPQYSASSHAVTPTTSTILHRNGCQCRKSSCIKRYCECFQHRQGCGPNCRCFNCENVFGKADNSFAVPVSGPAASQSPKAQTQLAMYSAPRKDTLRSMEPPGVPPTTPSTAFAPPNTITNSNVDSKLLVRQDPELLRRLNALQQSQLHQQHSFMRMNASFLGFPSYQFQGEAPRNAFPGTSPPLSSSNKTQNQPNEIMDAALAMTQLFGEKKQPCDAKASLKPSGQDRNSSDQPMKCKTPDNLATEAKKIPEQPTGAAVDAQQVNTELKTQDPTIQISDSFCLDKRSHLGNCTVSTAGKLDSESSRTGISSNSGTLQQPTAISQRDLLPSFSKPPQRNPVESNVRMYQTNAVAGTSHSQEVATSHDFWASGKRKIHLEDTLSRRKRQSEQPPECPPGVHHVVSYLSTGSNETGSSSPNFVGQDSKACRERSATPSQQALPQAHFYPPGYSSEMQYLIHRPYSAAQQPEFVRQAVEKASGENRGAGVPHPQMQFPTYYRMPMGTAYHGMMMPYSAQVYYGRHGHYFPTAQTSFGGTANYTPGQSPGGQMRSTPAKNSSPPSAVQFSQSKGQGHHITPENDTKMQSSNVLPRALSFRKICSSCGRTRAEHGDVGFGNNCPFSDCGKCGASKEAHTSAGIRMGFSCNLSVEDGASPGSSAKYMEKIRDLTERAEIQRQQDLRRQMATSRHHAGSSIIH